MNSSFPAVFVFVFVFSLPPDQMAPRLSPRRHQPKKEGPAEESVTDLQSSCLCDDIDDDDGQVDSLIFVWRASYKESILYQGGNFGDKGLQPLRLFIISL